MPNPRQWAPEKLSKTKKIIFRVDEGLFDFIHNFANANRMTPSEFVRRIVIYFNVGYMVGDFRKPIGSLEKKFLAKFPTDRKALEHFRQYRPVPLRKVLQPTKA